jgi:hypothetical protein
LPRVPRTEWLGFLKSAQTGERTQNRTKKLLSSALGGRTAYRVVTYNDISSDWD